MVTKKAHEKTASRWEEIDKHKIIGAPQYQQARGRYTFPYHCQSSTRDRIKHRIDYTHVSIWEGSSPAGLTLRQIPTTTNDI